jgi:hypothetical protein
MSTKITIAHGPGFHLFNEAFEYDTNVYLELENIQFECSPDFITIEIPVVIWEVIRQSAGTDFDWAAKSDDEIRLYVEKEVDQRLANFQAGGLILGRALYGEANDPRETQIERALPYYFKKRDKQRNQLKQIQELTDRIADRHRR